jgi:hypothetical protein
LERLLGIRIDLTEFYRLAARDGNLGPLAERFRGLKPPRLPTLFEGLVNGIACQQMSLTLGILLLNRKRLTNYTGDDVGIVADAFRLAQAAGVSSGPQFCSKRHRQFREGPYPFARASAPKR